MRHGALRGESERERRSGAAAGDGAGASAPPRFWRVGVSHSQLRFWISLSQQRECITLSAEVLVSFTPIHPLHRLLMSKKTNFLSWESWSPDRSLSQQS